MVAGKKSPSAQAGNPGQLRQRISEFCGDPPGRPVAGSREPTYGAGMNHEEALAAHPHDGYFKAAFEKPEYAALFFQSHLPAALAAPIDWSTMQTLPGSFIAEDLKQSHSDLLFSVQSGGSPLLLYLLFEHQTSVDPAMALRLPAYLLAVLQRHEKEYGLPLPPVVSFVLHQGPEKWTVSPQFADLFSVPAGMAEALRPWLPDFRHGLLDLSTHDPATAEGRTELRVVLQLMKLAREQRLLEFFAWLADIEAIMEILPDWLLRLSLLYALHAEAHLDVEAIFRNLSANPKLKSSTMSLAQRLIAEGEARGKAEGKTRGLWTGRLQVLEQLLGVPMTPETELDSVSVEEIERRFHARQAEYDAKFKVSR